MQTSFGGYPNFIVREAVFIPKLSETDNFSVSYVDKQFHNYASAKAYYDNMPSNFTKRRSKILDNRG
jgi:hypothetical protein